MRLGVKVIPNANHTQFGGRRGTEILLRVAAPAVDGKANEAARRHLARSFGVRPSAVRLVAGEKSRHKKFEIVGLEAHRVREIMDDLLEVADTGR